MIEPQTWPAPVPGSAEWNRWRVESDRIGGSQIADVIGIGFGNRFTLYHQLRGNLEPKEDNPLLRMGRDLEPIVAKRTAEWMGVDPERFNEDCPGVFIGRSDYRHSAVLLDRIVDPHAYSGLPKCHPHIIDMKYSTATGKWGPSGSAEFPANYFAQVQYQLFIAGPWYKNFFGLPDDTVLRGAISVLLPHGELRVYEFVEDPVFGKMLADEADRFMKEHVLIGVEPEPNFDDKKTLECLKRLPASEVPKDAPVGTLSKSMEGLCRDFVEAQKLAKKYQELCDSLRAAIAYATKGTYKTTGEGYEVVNMYVRPTTFTVEKKASMKTVVKKLECVK